MRKAIQILILIVIGAVAALGQSPAQCRVSKTFYTLAGAPDKNATLTVFSIQIGGTGNPAYTNGRLVLRTDSQGRLLGADNVTVGVDLPQGAIVRLYSGANAQLPQLAENPNAGTQYQVPNKSTANLDELIWNLASIKTKGGILVGGVNGIASQFTPCPDGQMMVWDAAQALGTKCATLTAALGYTPVNRAGDTMAGALVLSGAPTLTNHAATKGYVDGLATMQSFNGRQGAVTPQSGDYSFAQIGSKPTTLLGYGIADAQPLSTPLTQIAGLSPLNDDILQRKSGLWTNRSVAQFKSDLALTKSDVGLGNVENTALATWVGSTNLSTLAANLVLAGRTRLTGGALAFGSSFTSLGDSITFGQGATTPSTGGYVALLATATGLTATNLGVAGNRVADTAPIAYGLIVGTGSIYTLMIGTNEAIFETTTTAAATKFQKPHQAIVAWLAIPDSKKVKALGGSVTYGGTWTTTSQYSSTVKTSTTNGDTATFTVKGRTVYVGMVATQSGTGTFTVSIDGVSQGTFNTDYGTIGSQWSNTSLTYTPLLLRFPNLAERKHTVVITNTNGGNVLFHWAAGSGGAATETGPNVFVGTLPPLDDAAYTLHSNSEAVTASFNAEIRRNVAQLAADGLNVGIADTHGAIDQATDLADGTHPNDTGHTNLKNAFLAAMNGASAAPNRATAQLADFARIGTGTIDGATIGATNPSTGAFTTLAASGASTFTNTVLIDVASTQSLRVRNGNNTPALTVVSGSGAGAGVSVEGRAAGSSGLIQVVSSSTNENLQLLGKGTGGVTVGGNSIAAFFAQEGALQATSSSTSRFPLFLTHTGSASTLNGFAMLAPSLSNNQVITTYWGRNFSTDGNFQIAYRYSNTSPTAELSFYGRSAALIVDGPTGTIKAGIGDVAVADSAKGLILKSPGGTCYRLTVDNAGAISTASVTCP